MKNLTEFPYLFSFQDKFCNEHENKVYRCYSKKEAINLASNLLANFSHNDITQIKTKKQWLSK